MELLGDEPVKELRRRRRRRRTGRAVRKERCRKKGATRTDRPQSGHLKDHRGPLPAAAWRLWGPLLEQPSRRHEGRGLSSVKLKNE